MIGPFEQTVFNLSQYPVQHVVLAQLGHRDEARAVGPGEIRVLLIVCFRGRLAVVDALEVIATEHSTHELHQLRLEIATTAVQEEYLLGSLCVPKRRERQDVEHRVERRVVRAEDRLENLFGKGFRLVVGHRRHFFPRDANRA